jgi:UPF0755 protein
MLLFHLAHEREGYLFPDTYYFGADAHPEKIIQIMSSTFDRKIQVKELTDAIEKFGASMKDVITMASILEGEARQMRTRRIVAGILMGTIAPWDAPSGRYRF